MASFRIRPRFHQYRKENQEEVEKALLARLQDGDHRFISTHIPGHIIIRIRPEHRHFWSPQLQLSFESSDEGTLIRGLYGPNPTVWAVFFFGYAILGLSALIAGMWVISQYMLNMAASLWWILPLCAGLAVILYLIAQMGQKLGAAEMFDLHHFYEEILGEKVVIS